MYFGQNLQFLRKMHQGMTQEELAEKLNVSRQTISKWEMEATFPEMEKAITLCNLFSCSLDELLRQEMSSCDEAYENIRMKLVPEFSYVKYAVISENPEDDALEHIRKCAFTYGIESPEIIGWDFPFVTQEQINVFHMHGYVAVCILNQEVDEAKVDLEIHVQSKQQYAVITIKYPFNSPFTTIPNAYKILMKYLEVTKIFHKKSKDVLSCFEKVYEINNISYMDIYIAVEDNY